MDTKRLFWWVVTLNVIDCIMTTLIIQAGGYEANEVVRWYLNGFGALGVVLPKLFPLVVLGVVVYRVKVTPRVLTAGMSVVGAVYTILVAYQFNLYL
jgi:hypothetical protein